MTRYNFVDDNATTDVSYYRLKQMDFDGTISYSPVRAVEGTTRWTNSDFVVFPNPATDQVRLRLSEVGDLEVLVIQVTDVQGRLLQNEEIALQGATTLDWSTSVADFKPGVYFTTIRSIDGKQQWQQKIVVR